MLSVVHDLAMAWVESHQARDVVAIRGSIRAGGWDNAPWLDRLCLVILDYYVIFPSLHKPSLDVILPLRADCLRVSLKSHEINQRTLSK